MGTVQGLNLKRASQPESTIEEITRCDVGELLKWFDKNRPKALTSKSRDKFEEAEIDGITFLEHAGDKKYFYEGCKLPIGTSERLARLATEIVGGVTAGIKSKFTIFIYAHYVNYKLTTSQETDSRPKMWSCPSANLVSPLHPLSVDVW